MFLVATEQSVVMTHLTAAGVAVAAIQWVKNSGYFSLLAQNPKLLRALAVVTSAIGAIGVSYAWHPYSRELVFKIPTVAATVGILAAWAKSFVMQEIVYQGTAKNGLGELLNLVRAIATAQGVTPKPPAPSVTANPKTLGNIAAGGTGAVVLLCFLVSGCAVRHLPTGGTVAATKFEQVLAWNAGLAQVNNGFADNVIALSGAGTISKDSAHVILYRQGLIAQADKGITADLKAAALCGSQNAGANPTAQQLSDASGACAKTYAAEFKRDFGVITQIAGELTTSNPKVLGLSDKERQAIAQTVASLQMLVTDIVGVLQEYGAVPGSGGIVQ